MKKLIKLPAIVLGLLLLLTGFTQRAMAQDEDVSLQSFYDELSPYGTWIQDPQYGYVWRPDVDQQDFRPYYSNGRWAMTEYGNTWVSDYDWGWAPFHYGRWVYNRYRQWLWIPDTTWGPAWVSWRSGGGYYGWAPLSPGLNININIGIPDNWWVFIPQANIYYDRFPRYYSRRNVTIIHHTTIINNTYERGRRTYYTGPRIDDVRRATRGDVTVYRVNRTDRSGRSEIRGNELNIYNPRPSREARGTVQAPRNSIQGDANFSRGDRNNTVTTGRPSRSEGINGGRTPVTDRNDRGNRDNVNPSVNNRPSRSDAGNVGTGNTVGRPENRPSRENNSPATLPNRNPEVNPSQTDRTYPNRENRPSRVPNSSPNVPQQQQPAAQQQPQPQVRPQREQRPQQMPQQQQQQNPQPSQRAERQERPMPQQQPQRQQEPQRQAEPQRQPQAQPQREERQSAPPRSESRSSEGRSEGARSSRGGRG